MRRGRSRWTISQLVSKTASMKLRSTAALSLLLTTPAGLTQVLEGVSGSVIIGHPLDIVVQSRHGSGELDSVGCVRAEVRYGETQLPAHDVRIGLAERQETGGRSLAGYRVQALRPLDEPYVVLSVVVGCGSGAGTFRREWTLLASVEADRGNVPNLSSADIVMGVLLPTDTMCAADRVPRGKRPVGWWARLLRCLRDRFRPCRARANQRPRWQSRGQRRAFHSKADSVGRSMLLASRRSRLEHRRWIGCV